MDIPEKRKWPIKVTPHGGMDTGKRAHGGDETPSAVSRLARTSCTSHRATVGSIQGIGPKSGR